MHAVRGAWAECPSSCCHHQQLTGTLGWVPSSGGAAAGVSCTSTRTGHSSASSSSCTGAALAAAAAAAASAMTSAHFGVLDTGDQHLRAIDVSWLPAPPKLHSHPPTHPQIRVSPLALEFATWQRCRQRDRRMRATQSAQLPCELPVVVVVDGLMNKRLLMQVQHLPAGCSVNRAIPTRKAGVQDGCEGQLTGLPLCSG
jgi:hypothetical protein